jgi:hypothetical protein
MLLHTLISAKQYVQQGMACHVQTDKIRALSTASSNVQLTLNSCHKINVRHYISQHIKKYVAAVCGKVDDAGTLKTGCK